MIYTPDFSLETCEILDTKDPIKEKEHLAIIDNLENELIRQEEILLIKLIANRNYMFD